MLAGGVGRPGVAKNRRLDARGPAVLADDAKREGGKAPGPTKPEGA